MRKFIIFISSLLIFIVVALVFAADYFYGEAVKRGTEVELHKEEDAIPVMVDEENVKIIDTAVEWNAQQTYETIELTSYDGLLLEGYFLENENKTGKAVILAHGFRSDREGMEEYVQFYYDQGFDILIPDARGHGESEGDYIGYGWHERLDIIQWSQMLIDEKRSNKLLLHGVSMGASSVLMTSGEELPPEVMGIIADSGYTSAKGILTYQLQHIYNLPSFPLIEITSGLTKVRSGFGFSEASAVDQVTKNTLPLLLIHGEADELVPASMADEIYQAAGGEKTLWLVPDVGHVKAYTVATEEYQERLEGFIDETID
ncbi:alpha/beta hydrolase [Salipaludibacillus sp. HK11]|uniref:alpha/beta hydrolase n=1 Tax=Salipaludibacillus sp. HK11 TaxID=3394320 RepID=UPI0039FD9D30